MKLCSRCGDEKVLSEFYKDSRTKDGLYSHCKQCHKKHCRRYVENNRTRERLMDATRKRKAYNSNPEKFRSKSRKWRKDNPGDRNANNMKYRASKMQRTPSWLTKEQLEEIKKTYRSCPKDHHVDHIVPLRGKLVSGLHVPWNLQVLPAQENMQKGNRVNGGADLY